ncbi:hypothetical protein BJ546DRAFT_987669 [Cryomyces antarcticus]
MAPLALPRLLSHSLRRIRRSRPNALSFQISRSASSKHPKGFTAPAREDLEELRERVQEFTRREIPEEVAQKTDHSNEFPNDMWKKFGEAG